jgi:lipid-A-disaccharide synthase
MAAEMIRRVPEQARKDESDVDNVPLQIALVACEPSADRQGAELLKALRERLAPQAVEAWGIGGSHLRAAGMEICYDSDPWATIGIMAALTHIPYGLRVRANLKRRLASHPPDILILIDAGAFNMPVGRWAKEKRLCPIFYYFPSGSWRNKPHKGHQRMATVADTVVTPFPWSETLLRDAGVDAHFIGHPLLDLVHPTVSSADFYEQ